MNHNAEKRIGIMGGTFNPIHYGHLIIAENACEQYHLDRVIFMPTGYAPHKKFTGEQMTQHRCEMIRLAIEGNEKFSLSRYETEKHSTNYTYQTLHHMHKIYPDSDLYFILGADSLFDFDKWRRPELICQEAVILAAVRDYLTEAKVDTQIQHLKDTLKGEIYRLDTPNFNVSSKTIRSRLGLGQTIRYMVPDNVETYIKMQHLYQM